MKEDQEEVKSQSIETVLIFVFWNGLKGIVGYIASYFFRPWWEKIMKWYEKK